MIGGKGLIIYGQYNRDDARLAHEIVEQNNAAIIVRLVDGSRLPTAEAGGQRVGRAAKRWMALADGQVGQCRVRSTEPDRASAKL
jgi:hypothetical protein